MKKGKSTPPDVIQPAGYPANSSEELSATAVFKFLIDPTRIKPDIKELDKFPNIDGYLEITDVQQIPAGKVEVQIKKLAPKKTVKPAHQIKLEFLAYCKNIASLPVLLIVVDVANTIAYWKHVTPQLAAELLQKATGQSIVIHFDNEIDKIDQKEKLYIDQWLGIYQVHRNKLIDYDSLKSLYDNEKVTTAQLKKYLVNPTGEVNDKFSAIYLFLDHYNYLLDHDFNVVKRSLYPDVWKLGMAYTDFEPHHLAYVLYEINNRTNDTLIKVLKGTKPNDVGFDHVRMAAMNFNPVITRPENHAYKTIYDDLTRLLQAKAFMIINEHIAHEYLFRMIDSYHWLFGIPDKSELNKYPLSKFTSVVFEKWLSISFEMKFKYHTNEFFERHSELTLSFEDLIRAYSDRSPKFKKLLNKEISPRYEQYKDKVILTSDSYNFWFIRKCVQELENTNNTSIKMLYRRPDLKNELGVVWGGYSSPTVFANLKIIYTNFINAYHHYLEVYFPNLYDELKFFKDYDTLVIVLGQIDLTSVYPPKIMLIKYRHQIKKLAPKIEYFLQEKLPEKYQNYFGGGGSAKYSLEWCGMSGISFSYVYNNLPVYNYLHKYIETVFENYFKLKKDDTTREFDPFV